MKKDVQDFFKIELGEMGNCSKVRSVQVLGDRIQCEGLEDGIYLVKGMVSQDIVVTPGYLEQYKEDFMKVLSSYIRQRKDYYLMLSSLLIDHRIIEALGQNPTIGRIELGSEEHPYLFKQEDLDLLENHSNLKKIIVYAKNTKPHPLVDLDEVYLQGYLFSQIGSMHSLYFKDVFTEQEISLLSRLPNGVSEIYFLSGEGSNIVKAVQALKNFSGEVVISLENAGISNALLRECAAICRLSVLVSNKKIPFLDYLRTEEKLVSYLEPLLDSYSSLEKYLLIYDQVKNMKPYQENENHYESARDLYQILFNEYIVCEGYSNLLVSLLNKVGIPACEVSCAVEKNLEKEYHSRVLVHLVDSKYQLDGYYLSDPTWDSYKGYDHMLMTPFSVLSSERKFYMDFTDLFCCQTYQEMVTKLCLDPSYFKQLLSALQQIDVSFYQYYIEKYPDLGNISYCLERQRVEQVRNAIMDLFMYFKKKEQPVNAQVIEVAHHVVYDSTYKTR